MESYVPTTTKNDQDVIFPDFEKTAFFCCSQKSRYYILKLISSSWFERLTMFIILLNCITMSIQNPCEGGSCNTQTCVALEYLETGILVYFIFEATVKMLGMGLFGRKAYFFQLWNILDFFIVVAG